MERHVTRADFARLAGVTKAAITWVCAPGRALAPALAGTRIDVDHHAARDYLRAHGVHDPQSILAAWRAASPVRQSAPSAAVAPSVTPGNGAPAPQPAPGQPPAPRVAPSYSPPAGPVRGPAAAPAPVVGGHVGVPPDIEPFKDWTIQQLVDEFGTSRRFLDWLDALKRIEDVRSKRIANEEREGSLIPRDPVRTHVFGIIDSTFRRLLTDAPKTTARRLFALAKSGATVEDGEAEVRKINSSLIKAIKATAIRVLGK